MRVYPFQVFLEKSVSGLSRDVKVQCEQPRTISVRRISGRVGWIGGEAMGAIEDGLRMHLGL